MNAEVATAATLAALATLAHGILGELWILKPLGPLHATPFGDGAVTKGLVRGCWHFVTADFAVSAAFLVRLALSPLDERRRALLELLAVSWTAYLAIYVVMVFVVVRDPRLVLRVPQGFVFAAVAALAWHAAS